MLCKENILDICTAPMIDFVFKTSRGAKGEVLEWLKRLAWKACIPQKGIEGSNPSLSAAMK